MQVTTYSEDKLVDATLEQFSNCSNPLLEAFILCRCTQFKVKSQLPKKGKLQDAINGEQNMIRLAFESRSQENLLKRN